MAGPVIYVDTSEVREGRLPDVRAGIADLARVVEEQEPRLLSYAAFLDGAERRMTVIHVHADAASLALHMDVGGPLFSRFTELVRLVRIDVYGAIGSDLLDRLAAKAELLGGGPVGSHALLAGFVRAPAA